MKAGSNELSDLQLRRQDFVDNSVFRLIRSVHPCTSDLPWNIEMIGDVRDCLREWIVDRYGLCEEQSFYPYIEE
jgi:hypothetical protein